MKPIETLVALLCDPTGKVSIPGSPRDLELIQSALDTLKKQSVVEVTDYEWNKVARIMQPVRTYKAYFHGFFSEAIEYDSGFAENVVAVVEEMDGGKVHTVIPNHIRFVKE